MEEIWKDVINGKYMLSKKGILINKRTRKVVKGNLTKKGYIQDSFWVEGKRITKLRHRLMWETFIGEIPEGMEINHISECKTENSLSNLNLLSHRANTNWGTRNERIAKTNRLVQRNNKKKSKPVIQKTLEGEVIKIWPSTNEVERQLGYDNTNIGRCCNGKCKQRYGYIWEYIEEKATA